MFEQRPSHEHDRDGDDRDEDDDRLEAPAPGRASLTAWIGTGATRPRRRRGTPGKVTRTAAMERGERDVVAPIVELLDDERFGPESADGRRLLAHEMAHVAQARLPVATPTPSAAAGEAATGLAELGAAGSEQQALLRALEEECTP